MKASFSKQKDNRTQALMQKSNRSSNIQSLPKTKDGNQDYGTDSDLERRPMFTDIWPSSEPFSPSYTPTSKRNVPQSSTFKSSEVDTEHNSVLARYFDCLHHAQPQSREERQQNSSTSEEQLPFWWASSPSLPPNLMQEKTDQNWTRHNRAISPCRGSPSVLSDNSQCEPYDPEILQQHERASRLLQKGLEEDSLPVSSDVLEFSDFSSPVSADEPVRKPMISSLPKYNTAKDPLTVMPSLVTPLRWEEDILLKWRLRRKMEREAREWTSSQQHFDLQGWQEYSKSQPLHPEHQTMASQTIHPPDLPQGTIHQSINGPLFTTLDQQTRVTATATTVPVVPSGSVLSSPHVPSHLHLLCDILPCPNRPSSAREEETVSNNLDSQIIVLPCKTQNLPSEPPITGRIEKYVHSSCTKITKAPKKQLENSEKRQTLFSIEQKKSTRDHSRKKMPAKISNMSLQHPHKYSRGDGTSQPSPIESALEQVVSETLFPSMDSTIVQNNRPASPPCLVSEPQHSNYYESVQVISQFLQEAEDSDEKEFDEDPLLEVLRKQRKWVKEQINEVETLLKEFQEHKM